MLASSEGQYQIGDVYNLLNCKLMNGDVPLYYHSVVFSVVGLFFHALFLQI